MALSLDHAYQAFESMLIQIEGALGLPERTGAQWYSSLLMDSTLDLPGLRPPVVPFDRLVDWHALLRFRHFLRHAYAVELDPEELHRNFIRLERAVEGTDPTIRVLCDAFRRMPDATVGTLRTS